ncbi:MAG: hypothetical protein LUD02_08155 [Tannerellaceae bacterium]|nr:hypothetical protein [Tannerellaceae bacterium]
MKKVMLFFVVLLLATCMNVEANPNPVPDVTATHAEYLGSLGSYYVNKNAVEYTITVPLSNSVTVVGINGPYAGGAAWKRGNGCVYVTINPGAIMDDQIRSFDIVTPNYRYYTVHFYYN